MPPESNISRRGFLVVIGTTALGRFNLPEVPAEAPTTETPDTSSPLHSARMRRVLVPPQWGKNRQFLMWVEDRNDGEELRHWKPETDQEWADANRFYEIVTWRRWCSQSDLQGLVRDVGPWLVRWNSDGLFGFRYRFLRIADWNYLFGPESDQNVCYSSDPDEENVMFLGNSDKAALLATSEVLTLIPQLMKDYGMDERQFDYFEPVLPSDAQRDFRAEIYSLPKES